MKKYFIFVAILALTPSIAFAAWWNPLSWGIFSFLSSTPPQSLLSTTTESDQAPIVINTSADVATSTKAVDQAVPIQTTQDTGLSDKKKFESAYKALARVLYTKELYLIDPEGDLLTSDIAQVETGVSANDDNATLEAAQDTVSVIEQIQGGIAVNAVGMQYAQQAEINLQTAADAITNSAARPYAEMVASFAPIEVAEMYKYSTDTNTYYTLLLGVYSNLVSDGGDYAMTTSYFQNQQPQVLNAKNAMENDQQASASDYQMTDAYKNFESAYGTNTTQ